MGDPKQHLITIGEALRELNQSSVKSDSNLLELIESSTDEIEGYLGRKLVTRGTVTEYHEPCATTADLFLRERPIISVTSVHETSGRTYDSTTLLVEDTNFLVYTDEGNLVRMASSGKSAWLRGALEGIKVIYTGGYATVLTVPADIKKVCREHVAMLYREVAERLQNQDSISDDFGSVRRSGPPALMPWMRARLYKHRNLELGAHTWTRSTAA